MDLFSVTLKTMRRKTPFSSVTEIEDKALQNTYKKIAQKLKSLLCV
jgi:hypothetical protein